MIAASFVDAMIAALVVVVAGWITLARATFSAVIGFVAYGLLLALVWVRLAAPDVAMTEAAIGSGVTGVVLLAAAGRLRSADSREAGKKPGRLLRIAAAALSALIALALAQLVRFPADPAPTLVPQAVASLPQIGLGNPVTGVLIAYRAIDTLMESVVLLIALLGMWSLAPDLLWGGRPEIKGSMMGDGPLPFLARVLPPIGIVVAVYLVWIGSDAPGGEFQGATILAAMWILTIMAGVREPPRIDRRWLRLMLVSGPAIFIAIGFAGFAWTEGFLGYPPGYAKTLILAIELPLTLSIAAMLTLLVAGPPARTDAQ